MYMYLRLMNELEELILKQPFKDGQKLPSIRTLSEQYGCSKSTIIKALDELEKRHLIYAMPKSGYYVVKGTNSAQGEASPILNFSAAAPDPNVFPYLYFQHCINKAIDTYQKDLFVYGTAKGMASLIDIVRKQLMGYQVFTEERNIFVVSGVQQALSLLAAHLADTGATAILSTPLVGEVDTLVDRVGVLRAGRLIAQQPLDALVSRVRRYHVDAPDGWTPSDPLTAAILRRDPSIGRAVRLVAAGTEDEIIAAVVASGAVVRDVTAVGLTDIVPILLQSENSHVFA